MSKDEFINSLEEINDQLDPGEIQDWMKGLCNNIHAETIIWRGREYDTWNMLTSENIKRFYPTLPTKPLRVHTYKKGDLKFFEYDAASNERWETKNLDVKPYLNIDELVHNIIEGGNNIIYPPMKHYLSTRLKESINTKRNATDKRNRRGEYIDRKFLSPEISYLAERDIFLFEIFEYLFRENSETNSRKFYTAIIDESHDLFRANAPDIYYWIIECMVDVIIETRKLNLSLACMTHALNLIDYRILERVSHWLWLPGAKPTPNYSDVDPRLAKKLKTGQGIVESMMSRGDTGNIGGFTFNRIPKELPLLSVEGMTERKSLSSLVTDDEFEAVTQEG